MLSAPTYETILAREQLDAIRGVRSASLLWIDFLEGTITALDHGHHVDIGEFRSASQAHLERLGQYKFAHTYFDETTLLEHLLAANTCVSHEVAAQTGEGGRVGEATYFALKAAFDARAALTPMLTGQTESLLRRLNGRAG
jgi:hypothetical protein